MNPDGPEPVYVQIADALKAEIETGRLEPGAKLPSTRLLAERYKVSGMTAVEALRSLRDEGMIFTTQRGSFVVDQKASAETVPAESPEYVALTKHLDVVDAALREMGDRLKSLETTVQSIRSGAGSVDQ